VYHHYHYIINSSIVIDYHAHTLSLELPRHSILIPSLIEPFNGPKRLILFLYIYLSISLFISTYVVYDVDHIRSYPHVNDSPSYSYLSTIIYRHLCEWIINMVVGYRIYPILSFMSLECTSYDIIPHTHTIHQYYGHSTSCSAIIEYTC